jgi:general secretion pathway protein K
MSGTPSMMMRHATPREIRRLPAGQGGIALIIVMWILTLLMLIASSFIHAMRTEINIVGNSVTKARLEAAAYAGVQRAILEMVKPPQIQDRWNTVGIPQSWSFNGQPMQVSILDESGKIDINVGNEALMRGLFRSQGATEEETIALMEAVLDWRDADSLKRPRGAEEAEYAAAGLAYAPANATFQSIEELRLVLGMTPALYQRLAPLITIYSRQAGINSQIASREVLRAIPGVTEAQLDEFLKQRELARTNKQPTPVFAPAALYPSFGNGVMNVRVEATSDDGSSFVREAVVLRLPFPKRSYTFLRWQEGSSASRIMPAGANITSAGGGVS